MQLFKPRGAGWGWGLGIVTMLPGQAALVLAQSIAECSSKVYSGVPQTGGTSGEPEPCSSCNSSW